MSLDRSLLPEIKPIEEFTISAPLQSVLLPGGVPLYYLNQGDQEVIRIDLMVSAGKWQQKKSLISSFTNLMLKEGAGGISGKEIAERLDYYGAWLQCSDGYHYSYLTIYSLSKFFKESLELLLLMFREPDFPEDAFEAVRNRYKQQSLLDHEKVQYLANKVFGEKLFGASHPYGRSADPEDYDRISIEDLKQFHGQYYRFDQLKIILSGKVSEEQIAYCGRIFPTVDHSVASTIEVEEESFIRPNAGEKVLVEKAGALQNGIRMGLPVVNRSHPDFPGLRVLNTILGGYFGSRLMSNIREDKGYTYGISSGIVSLRHAAYLSISTQTACEHTEALIREVYREIDRLRTEYVPAQELEMVRNYMLGDFVRSLDGTFSLIDAYISLLATDMETDFLYRQVEAVKSITPEEINSLAQRYLHKDWIEVVAGTLK